MSSIGLRWQPGVQGGTRIDMQDRPAPPATTGGPDASRVLSFNIPSRPAPNQPVPTELLTGSGAAGVPNLPSILNLLKNALSPSPDRGLRAQPNTMAGWLQQERGLPRTVSDGGASRAPSNGGVSGAPSGVPKPSPNLFAGLPLWSGGGLPANGVIRVELGGTTGLVNNPPAPQQPAFPKSNGPWNINTGHNDPFIGTRDTLPEKPTFGQDLRTVEPLF